MCSREGCRREREEVKHTHFSLFGVEFDAVFAACVGAENSASN